MIARSASSRRLASARAHHAADVRADHDQVIHAVVTPDICQQHRRGVHVIDRNIEKTLYLVGVQIHRQQPVDACGANHAGSQLGGDRHARRTGATILPGIAEIRHHRGHAHRGGALQRIDQGQQLEQVLRTRRAGWLDHEHFLPPNVFLDFDLHFAVAERADQRLAQRHAQTGSNILRQRAVRIAGKQHHRGGRIHSSYLGTQAIRNGWGGRIRTCVCGNQNPVP